MKNPEKVIQLPPATNLDWAEWAEAALTCPGRILTHEELRTNGKTPLGTPLKK